MAKRIILNGLPFLSGSDAGAWPWFGSSGSGGGGALSEGTVLSVGTGWAGANIGVSVAGACTSGDTCGVTGTTGSGVIGVVAGTGSSAEGGSGNEGIVFV